MSTGSKKSQHHHTSTSSNQRPSEHDKWLSESSVFGLLLSLSADKRNITIQSATDNTTQQRDTQHCSETHNTAARRTTLQRDTQAARHTTAARRFAYRDLHFNLRIACLQCCVSHSGNRFPMPMPVEARDESPRASAFGQLLWRRSRLL